MKKLLKVSVLLLAAVLVLGLLGCGDDDTNEPDDGSYPVDFTNHAPPSISVRNNTNQRLVAFKGKPEIDNLIGGIPANANPHGLTKSGFTASHDFALTLVTEAEFQSRWKAGGNDEVKKAEIFNVVYAFYNHNGTNNNVFSISSQSGGAGRLLLENPTAWNIEIRKDAHNGTTLGFIGSYTSVQTLNLEPDDYNFYPVMRRYNPFLGEVIDVVPVFPDGVIAKTPYFRALRIDSTPITWNFRTLAQDATANMVSGAAFIRVVNNCDDAIQFYNGSTAQQTSMASTFLNPGETLVFQVAFPRNPDQSFSNTHNSDFGVGVRGVGRQKDVPTRQLELDWLYEITVTGTNASNMVASELTPIQKMDIEGLFAASAQ